MASLPFYRRLAPLSRAAILLAVVFLVLVILLFGSPFFSNASHPPFGTSSLLEIQFVRNAEDVDLILGESPSLDREAMRIKIMLSFLSGVTFAALLITLGAWTVQRGARIAGWVSAACGAAAGLFSILENRAILALLDMPLVAITPGVIAAIRLPSIAKWIMVVIASALLTHHFYTQRNLKSK